MAPIIIENTKYVDSKRFGSAEQCMEVACEASSLGTMDAVAQNWFGPLMSTTTADPQDRGHWGRHYFLHCMADISPCGDGHLHNQKATEALRPPFRRSENMRAKVLGSEACVLRRPTLHLISDRLTTRLVLAT